jgi:chromosome segregation ATPase
MVADQSTVDPSAARKRRKQIISEKVNDDTTTAADCDAAVIAEAAALALDGGGSESSQKKQLQQREGDLKRTQVRYDPDVAMTKEQLAAWRREARRVRNRESAAASRQRTRSRIDELESEVEDWKEKYNNAMERLEHLQDVANQNVS